MGSINQWLERVSGRRVVPAKIYDSVLKKAAALEAVCALHASADPRVQAWQGDARVAWIIFTKDRPLQFHGLLASIAAHLRGDFSLTTIVRASDAAYRYEYERAVAEAGIPVTMVWEESFRRDLLATLRTVTAPRIGFLVDDIVFTEPTDLSLTSGFNPWRTLVALRLGHNITFCFNHKEDLTVPPLKESGNGFYSWTWEAGAREWGFPLSLDGNIFATDEIRPLCEGTPFHSPNSLEFRLQEFQEIFAPRLGVCWPKARIVNMPLNQVQTDHTTPHGNLTAEDCLHLWRAGKRFDIAALRGFQHRGTHEDVSPPLRDLVETGASASR